MAHNFDHILIYDKSTELQYFIDCTDSIIDFCKNQAANTATLLRQVFCIWLGSKCSIADKIMENYVQILSS